jgi:Tol biopolymer transport system component
MTGITHKQGRRYINALADGLIKETQRRDLDAHLETCAECRAYAAQMKNLESGLELSLHRRWDTFQEPSERLTQNIQSRARGVVMSNRINLGVRIVAGVAAIILLGLAFNLVIGLMKNHASNHPNAGSTATISSTATASPTTSTVPALARLIAFASGQNGNSEIYALGTDGSGLTNLTNNPAYDGNPVWSPDGSKIAFESDRNGKRDIFTMNSDGSGLTQLTHDSGNDILRASPDLPNYGVNTSEGWSPDGTHILFSNDRTGQWVLSVMNSDGSGVTQLMQAKDPPAQAALWSPDGKQVAYTLPTGNGWTQIVAVNMDGTNRRVIATGDPTKSNDVWVLGRMIAWSQDEQFFYYEYENGDGNWSILKTAADGAQAAQEVASGYALAGGLFGDAWLGKDGVLYYVTIPVGPSNTYRWHRTDTGKALSWDPFALCNLSRPDNITYYSPSWAGSHADSRFVLAVSCLNNGYSELYIPDSKTDTISGIVQIPTNWNESSLSWSADDQMVMIQGKDQSGKTGIYLLRAQDLQTKPVGTPRLIWNGGIDKAVLQPVPFKAVTTQNPLPAIPSSPAATSNPPLWKGTNTTGLIAFTSYRTGNPDIYVARSDGSGETDLTNKLEGSDNPVWSPDGNKIAFYQYKNDSGWVINVMNPDGSNLRQITGDGKPPYYSWVPDFQIIAWSLDSQKIAYLVSQPQDPTNGSGPAEMSLQIVDQDGNLLQSIDLGIFSVVSQLRWSPDGHSLDYVATQMATDASGTTSVTESDIDQISLDSHLPTVLVKSALPIDAWIGSGQTITYLVRDTLAWNLMRANAQGQTRLATWAPDPEQCSKPGASSWDTTASSSLMRWSPDGKRLLIEVNCPEAVYFYLGNLNGQFVKLINQAMFSSAMGPDPFSWSPDGQTIIFTSDMDSAGNLDLYELSVEAALKDNSTHPIRITTSGFAESSPDWQP